MKILITLSILLPALLFSQEIVTEEVHLKNGEISLPGTLTYPKYKEKPPLLIFIHGSGNVDRNGNQGGLIKANYIKLLADSLTTKGLAFYRYDKRTATPSNLKKLKQTTLTDFAEDAKIAINYFKNDNRFSGIHLIGHSQGSLIAMICVSKNIKSYTSLAGPSKSIDKVITNQITKQNEALGKTTQDHFNELLKTDTILKVNPLLISIFHPRNQKFLKNWALLDPTIEIKKLTIPILILNGDADMQVTIKNATELKDTAPKATLYIIKKMNHVLKEVNSVQENQKSYTQANFPLSKQLVFLIKDFITTHK